ncbi:MAG: aminomethyl-transferring glycine dehydrogenase [Phycisphaerales bacterium]|nr:aminomethyl-transferring glycine dehydrogenase [Phycisphaerales bacterium]
MPADPDPVGLLSPSDTFVHRHVGPRDEDIRAMLASLGYATLDELIAATVPAAILRREPLRIGPPRGEHELLRELRGLIGQNEVFRSLIGMGYYDTIVPPVIQRNILENPGWYTQYTPYQAEIAQGRLEALLNFQTMVSDLTGLPLANASLLDEATAAAEAMTMCHRCGDEERRRFFVAEDCHPQTINVVRTRARPLGFEVVIGEPAKADFASKTFFGALVQYPATDGVIRDYTAFTKLAHDAGVLVVFATDLLACTLLRPPGEFGADVAVGSAQRFGVPMGFGGPHAAFLATRSEFARQVPGRIIGVSKDVHGNIAYRLAVQTREQHIRREKATSNICTAQVLLAIMAGMYAAYHGPQGLRRIAQRVQAFTAAAIVGLEKLGHTRLGDGPVFDTLRVRPGGGASATGVIAAAIARRINLRAYDDGTLGLSFDESTTREDLLGVLAAFNGGRDTGLQVDQLATQAAAKGLTTHGPLARTSAYLTHPVFNSFHSEHEMLRYIKRLESRDLSLCHSLIPLGSCTMKLNGTSEMLPVTWPEFCQIHPYAPAEQTRGYAAFARSLEAWLAEITGLPAVSLQPNSGAAGEYAGLLTIRAYHESRGEGHRDVCLIPVSAHGTNPASATMAGCRVVAVACDSGGNIDLADLRAKAAEHRDKLAAIMVTYPSTHGVFEEGIDELCRIVHEAGGQVYMDGANMNAQVGLCRPGDIGADVCHLNLHKTFCIPHGGGGPGAGPICVAEHLRDFLPQHPLATRSQSDEVTQGGQYAGASSPSHLVTSSRCGVGPVAAGPIGSGAILPISWVYIGLMGSAGLTRATQVAILNANYMAQRLKDHYPVVYSGRNGRVAHEFIIDCRAIKKSAGVEIDDIAKRLMDFGFHAPTMSWPVAGTLMIEPTESESKAELDRLCDALIAIRKEIRDIEAGKLPRDNNPLKHAPHTAASVAGTEWGRPYPREQGAFPAPWVRAHKFWPAVGRVDNVHGDRHLFCTCPSVESLAE